MARKKDIRSEDIKRFSNVILTEIEDGKLTNISKYWDFTRFDNKKLVLELGCGKGEYTIALAQKHRDTNFIGIDIKCDRLWVGADNAQKGNLNNAYFMRSLVENIGDLFPEGSVDEIWITFPDPQPGAGRVKKRLTFPRYLDIYKKMIKTEGIIHLKTDSSLLYTYSCETIKTYGGKIIIATDDLYNSEVTNEDALSVKSRFEVKFLPIAKTIKYIEFTL